MKSKGFMGQDVGGDAVLRLSEEEALALLSQGQMGSPKLVPAGSNYTFLVTIQDGNDLGCWGIYKPLKGEAPLWDFPSGTLYKREYASYVLSAALGWPNVPPTVIREGVHGIGSVQLFVDADPRVSYLELRQTHVEDMQRIAAFDWLVNNADRKASHCLLGQDGKVSTIDHGLTFNTEFKLRTVVWDFQGTTIPSNLVEDLEKLLEALSSREEWVDRLCSSISHEEMDVLGHRLRNILKEPVFPLQHTYHSVPWPWF